MARVEVSDPASADIEDIWSYVASHNERAADRLVRRFSTVFARLARMPNLGQAYAGSLPGTRILTSGAYVIVYVVREDRIQISRVVHSARDWQGILETCDDSE
jgi:toxin ParE1/3/4